MSTDNLIVETTIRGDTTHITVTNLITGVTASGTTKGRNLGRARLMKELEQQLTQPTQNTNKEDDQ